MTTGPFNPYQSGFDAELKSGLRRYTCKAEQHAFKPPVSFSGVSIGDGRRGWKVILTESCVYDLGAADQADWCKLRGISFHPFTNHNDAFIFVWRWNTTLKVFEISSYCHVSKKTVMRWPMLMVPPDVPFYIWAEINYKDKWIRFHFMLGQFHYTHVENFDKIPRFNREIGGWFGGNMAAPHEMVMHVGDIWAWEEIDGILVPDLDIH